MSQKYVKIYIKIYHVYIKLSKSWRQLSHDSLSPSGPPQGKGGGKYAPMGGGNTTPFNCTVTWENEGVY